jgi:hypothetical protein
MREISPVSTEANAHVERRAQQGLPHLLSNERERGGSSSSGASRMSRSPPWEYLSAWT